MNILVQDSRFSWTCISLGHVFQSEIADGSVWASLDLLDNAKLFSTVLIVPCLCQPLVLLFLRGKKLPVCRVRIYILFILKCIFNNEIEHIFMCIWLIYVSSPGKMSVHVFWPFFYVVVSFSWLICRNSLSWRINILFYMSFRFMTSFFTLWGVLNNRSSQF